MQEYVVLVGKQGMCYSILGNMNYHLGLQCIKRDGILQTCAKHVPINCMSASEEQINLGYNTNNSKHEIQVLR